MCLAYSDGVNAVAIYCGKRALQKNCHGYTRTSSMHDKIKTQQLKKISL